MLFKNFQAFIFNFRSLTINYFLQHKGRIFKTYGMKPAGGHIVYKNWVLTKSI